MLILKMTEHDLKYFDELRENYPDNVLVRKEHGFDMTSSVQIMIDVCGMLPSIMSSLIPAIEMLLVYRIQKQQNIINKKEAKIHEREAWIHEREVKVHEKELELEKEKFLLEKAKAERNEFEIRISSNGESEIIVKTSDIISLQNNPENLSQFIENIRVAIGNTNENV